MIKLHEALKVKEAFPGRKKYIVPHRSSTPEKKKMYAVMKYDAHEQRHMKVDHHSDPDFLMRKHKVPAERVKK